MKRLGVHIWEFLYNNSTSIDTQATQNNLIL